MENVSNIITGLNIPDQIPLDVKAYCASESVLSSLGLYNNLAFVYYEGLVVRCQLEKTRWEWREVKPGERGLLSSDFQYPDNWVVYGFDYSLKQFNFFKVDYSSLDKDFSKIVYFDAEDPINATIFDLSNPPITNDDSLKEDDNNLYIGTDASSWIYDKNQNVYETYISSSNKSNFFITGTNNDAGGTKTGSITKKGEFVIDSETADISGLVLKQLVADSLSILKVDALGNVVKVSKVKDIDYEPLIPNGLPAQYYGGGKVWKNFPTSFPPSAHGHLATDIVETTNKLFQTSLQNQYNDATSSIQTQLDNLRNSIPDVYAQVVYVNSTSPTTATIFDVVNPPITNNNALKNNVLNLYIGSDASTWVYKTSPAGYVTKTITAITSNFNLAGTTTDAGNNKISDIERTGKIIAGGFKVNGTVGILKSDGTVDLTNYERISNKNQANGYVGLGSDSKILASQLPPSKIKNAANVDQFTYLLDQGFQITGAGDTSVSFDAANKRITISSTPGAGGGGAVVSFNGRTGAVVAAEGDYTLNLLGDVTITSLLDKSIIQYNSGTTEWQNKVLNTSIVPELTNLYYTNARAIAAPLTGYVSSPGIVLPTDSILQAFNKVNGNIGLKADLESPTFTGVPVGPTASLGTNTTQLATTEFVGNTLFDGLASKANLNGGNGFTGSQWFSDFTRHAKPIYLGTNSLNHSTLYSPVALGNIDGHFAFASDTRPPVVISTELLTNLSLVKLIVPNKSGTIALLSDVPSPITIDQTIIQNSTNAVSGGAVFNGLALKADVSQLHNPVTIGTANGLSLSTQVLSLGLASASTTGALSSTDYNEFKNKQNAITGISTNYLPKWNGTSFVNSVINESGNCVSINSSVSPSWAFNVRNSTLTGANQIGIFSNLTTAGTSLTYIAGLASLISVPDVAHTVSNIYNFFAIEGTKGASATVTNNVGLFVPDLTIGTNNRALALQVSAGTNKWNIFASGTANNYLQGKLLLGITTDNLTDNLQINGSAIATAWKTNGGTTSQFVDGTGTLQLKSQFQNAISHLEFNNTDKTIWNNGVGDIQSNTTFGELSLIAMVSGINNSGFGGNTLRNLSTGNNNSGIGRDALRNITTGSENVGLGFYSLFNLTTTNGNVGLGNYSLQNLITGVENIGIGFQSGAFLADGTTALTIATRSIYLGRGTRASANSVSNEIVIGDGAVGSGSNTVTLGNTGVTTTRLRGAVQGGSFVRDLGTSTQFLKADGSVDANTYALANGTNASGTWAINISGTAAVATLANVLNVQVYTDANQSTVTGLRHILNSTGSTGFPAIGGHGIEARRNPASGSSVGTFQLWANNSPADDNLYFRRVNAYTTVETWSNWRTIWDSINLVNPVTGTGAAGKISFWSAANTQISDTNLHWDNTNKRLGIGTSTPQDSLDIFGGLRLTRATNTYLDFWGTDVDVNTRNFRFATNRVTRGLFELQVSSVQGGGMTTTLFNADALTGNFGVGTGAAAVARVEIRANNGELLALNNNTTGSDQNTNIYMGYQSSGLGQYGTRIQSVGNPSSSRQNDFAIQRHTGGADNLDASWTTDFLIKRGTGFIGIGTNNPLQKLHISGGNILLENTRGINALDSASTAETILTITSGNNIVLASPTLSGSLQYSVRNASGLHQWLIAGTERMRLTSAGRLLLGGATENTSYVLNLTGAARFSDTVRIEEGLWLRNNRALVRTDATTEDFSVYQYAAADGTFLRKALEIKNADGTATFAGNMIVNGSVTATSLKVTAGTASQFLKADGSIDSNSYALATHTHTIADVSGLQSALNGKPFGTGSTNYIARWENNLTITDSNMYYTAEGLLLIGSDVEVIGTLNASGSIIVPNAVNLNEAVNKGQLDLKANLASPTFTGTPNAPTAVAGTNTDQLATTAFVTGALNSFAPSNTVNLTGSQTLTNAPKTFQVTSGTNAAITLINSGSTIGFSVTNSSTQIGANFINESSGAGVVFQSTGTSSGDIIRVDVGSTATGLVINSRNNGSTTFSLNKLGDITANKLIIPNSVNANEAVNKGQLDAVARPYKVYTAIINQTLTNPVSVLFTVENTIGNIIWSRVSAGVYEGTLTGAFTANNKTIAFVSNNFNGISATNGLYIQCKKITSDKVEIRTLSGAALTDGVITGATLEIRVYN